MYALHSDVFYFRAKPNDCTLDQTIKYITRYLGRPVIAASRVDAYDGENITFHYNRHEDDALITETIPALDFIKRLIMHIPEKHFKMVRHYGIYAKHHKQEKHLFKYLSNEKCRFLKSLLDWRNSILLTFGYDPLKCSKCGASMLVLEVYHKKTALFEQYRKQMGFG
nr:transposase [Anaerosporobacter sp.]